MPIARFQMPDGRVARFEVPEGTTPEQAQSMMQEHFQQPAQPAQPSQQPQGNQFLQGVGNLAAGAIRGASNIGATILNPMDEQARSQRKATIEQQLQDWGAQPESMLYKGGELGAEIAGTAGIGGALAKPFQAAAQVAPSMGRVAQALQSGGFNVGGPASTIGGKAANAALRVGGGAATGAAAGGIIDPSNLGTGAAIGGVLGGTVGPAIEKIGGAAVRRITKPTPEEIASKSINAADSAIKQMADDLGISVGDIPAELAQNIRQDVAMAIRSGNQIENPAAMLRKREFESLGIQPLQGQITRDPTQFAQELNLRGVSPEISGRLREQNVALQGLFGRPAAGAVEPYQAGSQIGDVLRGYDVAKRGEVSSLYKAARESAGKDLEVPMQGLAQDYVNVLDSFGDKVPSGVRNQFRKFGLEGEKQTKLFTVEEADKLMKVINSNVSNDPATNAALTQLRNSVRTSIESVDEGGGVFAPAVKAAKQRFSELDAIPALKAVAEGRETPDTFVNQFVLRGKTDEVKRMAELLRNESPESFGQAKAQVADDIRRAAFGENIAGDAAISPERLAKKLRELGTEKMSAFFSPDEIERYQTAARVANYIAKHPNAAPVNTSNTLVATLMQNPITRGATKGLELIPGGGIAIGAAKAATGAVKNEMAAAQAMNAKVPTKKLDLTESQRRLLVKALGGVSGAMTGQFAQ